MDEAELRAWTKRMGYAGEIPDNFELLNESTAHIWKQVVERVRPKYEVKQIRHNCLLTKLRPQPQIALLTEVTECPNKDFNLWKKKEDIKQEMHYKKEKYTTALRQLQMVKQKNNELITDIKVAEIKAQESQMKSFLFNKQCGKLRVKLKDVEKEERFLNEMVSLLDTKAQSEDGIEKKVEKLAQSVKVPLTLKDAMANKDVQDLYRNNHSNNLKDIVQCKIENLIHNINEISYNETICARQTNDIKEEQLNRNAKLHARHLESSLSALKLLPELKILEDRSQREKCEALGKLSSVEAKRFLEERLEGIEGATSNKLYAKTIAVMRHELESATQRSGGRASRGKLLDALAMSKRSLMSKTRTYDELARRVDEQHLTCKELLRAQMYACTLSIFAPLLSGRLQTAEANAASVFNLAYNRRCAFVENRGLSARKMYYRDARELNLPLASHGESMASVSRALHLPISDIEELKRYFAAKVAQKRRYEAFHRRCVHIQGEMQTNITQDAFDEDNCVECTRPLLDLSTYRFSSKKTITEMFDLWIEMPFSFYVPSSVLFDGNSYEFYADAFDCA